MRSPLLLLAAVLGWSALIAGVAGAAADPVLLAAGQQQRHPMAAFAAPGADEATIYIATRPDRATDGQFLQENVTSLDALTADELQAGRWSDAAQLDPGVYYVMLRARDDDCTGDPACLDGYSEVATVSVPVPRRRFRPRVRVNRFLSTVDLTLTVTPLGTPLRYRVCWTRRIRGRADRHCVPGSVDGYSWNAAASDAITVRRRGMRRTTTFTWYVSGRRVATRRARVGG